MTPMLTALRHVAANPVLRRELDVRARSKVSIAAVSLWLVLLGAITSLVYSGYTTGSGDGANTDNARIGLELFHWALFAMMSLVLFLVPAFTASAIAGERTRQTLVPVQMTALGPFEIVLGKSLAAIAFTALLVVAASPMLATAYLVGGVTVGDLASGIAMLLLTAALLGAIGIALSSIFKTVQAATVMTYGVVFILSIGSGIALAVVAIVTNLYGDGGAPPIVPIIVNPYVALADAVAEPSSLFFFSGPENPVSGIRQGIYELQRERASDFGFAGDRLAPNAAPEATALWKWYVGFAVITIYCSLYIATNRLRTPADAER